MKLYDTEVPAKYRNRYKNIMQKQTSTGRLGMKNFTSKKTFLVIFTYFTQIVNKTTKFRAKNWSLGKGFTNFPQTYEAPQHSRCKRSDSK